MNLAYGNIEVIEKINRVLPIGGDRVIHNNEIYEVKIQSEFSEEKLKNLVNKKINDVMYVMEFYQKENDEKFFRIFVTDPPKKKEESDKKEEYEVVFDRSFFEYRADNNDKNPDFMTFDVPYNMENFKTQTWPLILGIFLVFIFFPLFLFGIKAFKKMMKSKKIRQQFQKQSQEYIELILSAQSRKDFEQIYLSRKSIKNHIDVSEKKFEKFLNEINEHQYKEVWSETEIIRLKSLQNELGDLRVLRGV